MKLHKAFHNCKPKAEIPPRDHFAAGEVPAIVLVNYAGRTVTIRVNDVGGAMVWFDTVYVPQEGAAAWWSLETLPAGLYKADLVMEGTLLQSCSFQVNNLTPSWRSPMQR